VQQNVEYEVLIDAVSGASGGVLASLLLYPLENFRTRLQNNLNSKTNESEQLTKDQKKGIMQ
jgi:solute carrier family 25 (peroxisomal adenine nucleotide transporter), member 17